VIHIHYEDIGRKGKNTSNKLLLACKNKKISKNFILMADDIFILKKIKKLEHYKI
jgi:hypothetical protein